jgi:hypothetical protein
MRFNKVGEMGGAADFFLDFFRWNLAELDRGSGIGPCAG